MAWHINLSLPLDKQRHDNKKLSSHRFNYHRKSELMEFLHSQRFSRKKHNLFVEN